MTVANAGVSGDTSSDGLARLEWSVPAEADIVIVELGANDALRGIDPAVTRKALSEIVASLQARGQDVLLAGMLAPRNLGDDYAEEFNAIYPELAEEYDVPLYPFFLAGVVTDADTQSAGRPASERRGRREDRRGILPEMEKLVTAAAASG